MHRQFCRVHFLELRLPCEDPAIPACLLCISFCYGASELALIATSFSEIRIIASEPSVKIPSWKCFSSFELIVRGTPNLHTTYSHTNLSACLPFITVRGFASTHFMECSMAIAKNLKPPRAVGNGPRKLTPQ
ncbi:hypothetical protein Tco_0171866 [Tanacetum coccineum]